MPFFLMQWSYKDKEVKAMLTKPQNRSDIVDVAVRAFGGTLHQFFFSFGDYDGVAITEFPDHVRAKACLMSITGAGGSSATKTTLLLSPQEALAAMKLGRDVASDYTNPSDE